MKVESLWRRALENWTKLAISQSGPAAALKQKGLVCDAQGQTVLWAVFSSSHLLLDFLKRAVVQRWSNCTGGQFVSLLASCCLRCQYWVLTSAFGFPRLARDSQKVQSCFFYRFLYAMWDPIGKIENIDFRNKFLMVIVWYVEEKGIGWSGIIVMGSGKLLWSKVTLQFQISWFLFDCAKCFKMPLDDI